jgi:hypothetical protein
VAFSEGGGFRPTDLSEPFVGERVHQG